MEEYQKHLENCYFYLISHRPDLKPSQLKDSIALAKSLAIEYVQENKGESLYKYLDKKFDKSEQTS